MKRQLLIGYLVYSVLGTLLLSLPFCNRGGISVVDNLFSAISALSTTGLSTVDVSSGYTFWGQLAILLLIQLGGLGYMTFSSYVMFRLTRHLGTNEAKMFHAQFSGYPAALSLFSAAPCRQSVMVGSIPFRFSFLHRRFQHL